MIYFLNMNFLHELLIVFLASYLSTVNGLAFHLNNLFSHLDSPIQTDELAIEADTFTPLPSQTSKSIPDILLTSSAYQQASLAGSIGITGGNTKEPLEALVNIFCTFTTETFVRTTTGTGFFIDPNGVIITNAHVAQFLLLETTEKEGKTECIIRSGNPAAPQYEAGLLFISPAWVQQNASVMDSDTPMGTGERDYALLYVKSNVSNTPLPAQFPTLNFDPNLLPISTKDTIVAAAGYPATNMMENGPSADLIPKKATTTISELYTFGSNYADVFSIKGSEVGAEGASGGPVLNNNGDVIGIIVTRGDDDVDGAGSLRAITISHVDRTILQETGFTLKENMGGNLSYRGDIFAKTLTPFLVRILQQ